MSDLVERPKFDPEKPFTEMANRLNRNIDQKFGGAVVIVPPEGDTVEILVLDSKADVGQFWATIKSRIEIAVLELDEQRRKQQSFGGRPY